MRPLLALLRTPLGLLAAVSIAAPAAAQSRAGWTDPPARSAPSDQAAKPGDAGAGTAKSDTAKSDTAKSESVDSKSAKSKLAKSEPLKFEPAESERTQSRYAGSRQVRSRHAEPGEAGSAATAASSRPAGMPAAGADPRLAAWAGAARRLTEDYLASISAPNAATLGETPRFYGAQVRFHGRSLNTAALVAEKRRFFRRWPERSYAPREGDIRTVCDGLRETCTVRTVMDFRAASPARGVRSTGLAELVLTVSVAGARPVILSESSRVLRRGTV